jgi:hypothetical protein
MGNGPLSIKDAQPDDERPVRLSSRIFAILLAGMATLLGVGAWAVPDHLKLKDDFSNLKPEVRQLQKDVTGLDERQDADEARHAAERARVEALMLQVLEELRKRPSGKR